MFSLIKDLLKFLMSCRCLAFLNPCLHGSKSPALSTMENKMELNLGQRTENQRKQVSACRGCGGRKEEEKKSLKDRRFYGDAVRGGGGDGQRGRGHLEEASRQTYRESHQASISKPRLLRSELGALSNGRKCSPMFSQGGAMIKKAALAMQRKSGIFKDRCQNWTNCQQHRGEFHTRAKLSGIICVFRFLLSKRKKKKT